MAKKYGVILDSTTPKVPGLEDHPDVYWLPLRIIVDGQDYQDGVNINNQDLGKYLHERREVTSSQPNIASIVDTFEEASTKGYDHIFAIALSTHLSGTYSAFLLAQEQCELDNLTILDSESIAGPVAIMAQRVLDGAEADESPEEVMEALLYLKDNNEGLVHPSSLERLMISGRLRKSVGTIASMLRIRILLSLPNKPEKVESHGLYRSNKKMMNEIFDQMERIGVNEEDWIIYLLDFDAQDIMAEWEKEIKEKYPNITIKKAEAPTVISIHVGEGTVIIQFTKVK